MDFIYYQQSSTMDVPSIFISTRWSVWKQNTWNSTATCKVTFQHTSSKSAPRWPNRWASKVGLRRKCMCTFYTLPLSIWLILTETDSQIPRAHVLIFGQMRFLKGIEQRMQVVKILPVPFRPRAITARNVRWQKEENVVPVLLKRLFSGGTTPAALNPLQKVPWWEGWKQAILLIKPSPLNSGKVWQGMWLAKANTHVKICLKEHKKNTWQTIWVVADPSHIQP